MTFHLLSPYKYTILFVKGKENETRLMTFFGRKNKCICVFVPFILICLSEPIEKLPSATMEWVESMFYIHWSWYKWAVLFMGRSWEVCYWQSKIGQSRIIRVVLHNFAKHQNHNFFSSNILFLFWCPSASNKGIMFGTRIFFFSELLCHRMMLLHRKVRISSIALHASCNIVLHYVWTSVQFTIQKCNNMSANSLKTTNPSKLSVIQEVNGNWLGGRMTVWLLWVE